MQAWALHDLSTWQPWQYVAFGAVVIGGMELLNVLIPIVFCRADSIPYKSKTLEKLEAIDLAFIISSRIFTIPFIYCFIRFAWTSERVDWGNDFTLLNTVVAFVALFVLYDMVYTLMHRAMHIRALYPYVHKHHHRQHSPFRGNVDAINVHPVEYIAGEFLHLLAAYVLVSFGIRIHAATLLAFILVGGVLASLNHTRHDVRIPPSVYDVRVHDVHHRNVNVNYGQYIMLWDRVWGTYVPYEGKDSSKAT